jgi:hypothetical protein
VACAPNINGWCEADTGELPEASRALVDLGRIDVHAKAFGKRTVHHRDEGAIAAPVIEQAASALSDEPGSQFEPASMTPGDEPAAAEDLLPRVVTRFQQVVCDHRSLSFF